MATKVRPKIDDEGMFSTFKGPAAVVRNCKCCKHFELVKKGLRGAGRSYGFVAGNKARGMMIQHFKTAHPERYAELGKEAKARAAAANERLGT